MPDYDKNGVRIKLPPVFERADPHFVRILETVTPLFAPDEHGRVEFVGSAVGIAIGPHRFVATAAHVADLRFDHILHANGTSGLVKLHGDITRGFATDASRGDHIDLSIYRLEKSDHAQWPQAFFASWNELDHAWPPPARHSYLAAGFPASKNRKALRGDTIHSAAYQFGALDAEAEVYESLGHSRDTTLILGFDRKTMHGPSGKSTAPDLYGMSGSGAWRVGRRVAQSRNPAKLSAFLVEWHKKGQYPHLLGTRVRVLVSALVDRYADVASTVEALVAGDSASTEPSSE